MCNLSINSFGGELFEGSKKFCLRLYSPLAFGEFGGEDKFCLIGIILLLSWMMCGFDIILYII
jgi:hypothetical protein